MKKLSIIIPLYNVEKYASDTTKSILSQHTNDIEVILVDDGSTDNSLQAYTEKLSDLDVLALRQENTGPGGARNLGIRHASGEYLLFLDSDDFLLPNAVVNILSTLGAKKSDVLFGRYMRWTPTTGFIEERKYDFKIPKTSNLFTEYIIGIFPETSWNSAWRYVCRREFILSNEIFFNDTMYCEDMKWVLELLDVIEKTTGSIEFLPEPFYGYNYRRTGSIMNGTSPKRIIDLAAIVHEALGRYIERPTICKELIWQVFFYINEYCTFDKCDRSLIYESYKPLFPLFRLSQQVKYKFAGLFRTKQLFYMLSALLYCAKTVRRRILYGIK